MTGTDRRNEIVKIIQKSPSPVPARSLAASCQVSRQVIVQDIALLRAAGYDILSTNRGYILNSLGQVERVFKVRHTNEQMEEELNAIVDMGGCVKDVAVNHRIYGRMEAELNISSRRKIALFLEDIKHGSSSPLSSITSGYHYHTVSADSRETLDAIEEMLRQRGFLVETFYFVSQALFSLSAYLFKYSLFTVWIGRFPAAIVLMSSASIGIITSPISAVPPPM